MGQNGDENTSGGFVLQGSSPVGRWQICFGHLQGSSNLPTSHAFIDFGDDNNGGRERLEAFGRLACAVEAADWDAAATEFMAGWTLIDWQPLSSARREQARMWLRQRPR